MQQSTCYSILEVVRQRLQQVAFEPVGKDSIPRIKPENIQIWKDELSPDASEKNLTHILTPGIVITPPKQITRSPMAGTNGLDDVVYPVLAQLIAGDGGDRVANLQTYLRWEEQIADAFHAQSVPEVDKRIADVFACFATTTAVVDLKYWIKHSKFVSGVALVFSARRNARGVNT